MKERERERQRARTRAMNIMKVRKAKHTKRYELKTFAGNNTRDSVKP